MNDVGKIAGMLRQFVDGFDRSREFAGKLEVMLDDEFPEDPRFCDLVLALASYQPGGGEYLVDELQMVQICKAALSVVESLEAQTR